MAEKSDADVELANKGGGMKKIILLAVIIVLLMGGSIGATLFFVGGSSDSGNKEQAAEDSTENAVEIKPAIYLLLKPDFIINFEDNRHANFLSVQLQVMAREQSAIDALEVHMPVLRNDILLLLSAQKYEEVRTREGKQKLQAEILKAMQQIVSKENQAQAKEDEENAPSANIEAVYFTSFIMQ